jgi:hypothetical protein
MALVLADRQCFSHGQVYVAMSRVTNIDGIRVFSPHTCRDGHTYIDNVVYYELIDDATPPILEYNARAPNDDEMDFDEAEEVPNNVDIM